MKDFKKAAVMTIIFLFFTGLASAESDVKKTEKPIIQSSKNIRQEQNSPEKIYLEKNRYLYRVFKKYTAEKDILYAEAPGEKGTEKLYLDIYQPEGDIETNRPVIIWVHGGGFTSGDKSVMMGYCADFARLGYVTLSINYRLKVRPDSDWEKAFRDGMEDTASAIKWLRDNRNKYRINPDLIAIGGESAGGMISVNLACSDLIPEKSALFSVIDIFGSRLFYPVNRTTPPMIMIHGTKDQLVPYETSIDLSKKLNDKGIFNELYTMEGEGHGISSFFYDDIYLHIVRFLYGNLKGYSHSLFQADFKTILTYPGKSFDLNLKRDKKESLTGGSIYFEIPEGWSLEGRTNFNPGEENITLKLNTPADSPATNEFIFYKTSIKGETGSAASMLVIKIVKEEDKGQE